MQNNRGTFDRSPIACHFLGLGNFFTATNSPRGAQWFLLPIVFFFFLLLSAILFNVFWCCLAQSYPVCRSTISVKKVTFHFQIFENKIFNNEKTLMVKKVVWIEIDLLMLWFSCSIDCTYILYFRWTIPSFFFFYFFIHWTKGCKQSLPLVEKARKRCS